MNLYLCGAGNSEGVRLALAVNCARQRWDRLVLLDDDPAKHGRCLLGVEITGPIRMLEAADPASSGVANLVARTAARRWAVRQKLEAYGLPFATLIHPRVDLTGTELNPDVMIYQNAVIGPEVRIEAGSVVFMGAVVGHESRVGRGCIVAANAVLNARVELGDRVYVGSNATLLPEVKVGPDATIGAGSTVIQDVPGGATALGVPAQLLTPPEGWSEDAGPLAPEAGRLPASDLTQAIKTIWAEVLHLSEVGEQDNFFDLGGSSLLALQVFERLRQATRTPLLLTDLFRFPTVRALAEHLSTSVLRGAPVGFQRAQLRRQLHRAPLAHTSTEFDNN